MSLRFFAKKEEKKISKLKIKIDLKYKMHSYSTFHLNYCFICFQTV